MSLHCIGMARAEGDQTIGQEEYEVQFQKHSTGKQINALAKNIARVIVFMGLEPLQGATAMPLGESDIYGANAQCSIEPNHVQSDSYSWMFIMMCSILILAVGDGFAKEQMTPTQASITFTRSMPSCLQL